MTQDKNLNPHKTKTQKILDIILQERPGEALKPPMDKKEAINSDRNDQSLPEIPRSTPGLPCNQGQEDPQKDDPSDGMNTGTIRPTRSPLPSERGKAEGLNNPGTKVNSIPGGSFIIARKLFSSSIWTKDPIYLKIWFWIIGQASYEPRKMKGVECKRGEFITTYHEIIKAASYFRNKAHIVPRLKQIRIILTWLEKQDMIRVEAIKSNFPTGADPRADTGADLPSHRGTLILIKIIN